MLIIYHEHKLHILQELLEPDFLLLHKKNESVSLTHIKQKFINLYFSLIFNLYINEYKLIYEINKNEIIKEK
jgi:hypothetical protein